MQLEPYTWRLMHLVLALGARLSQVKDSMSCLHDKILDNVILHLTAFANKSISNAVQCYSDIEHEALRILHGLENFHLYCFHGKYASSLTIKISCNTQ